MNRRDFLQMAAAGTLGFGFPCLLAAHPAPALLAAHPPLLELFDRESVLELGAAYRRAFPGESDPDRLAQAVLPPGAPDHLRAGPGLEAYLHHRIRGDFERGETVRLNGWILSVTEARQCALFSLLHA